MTISFDTRADAIAATIPPATKQFTVYGYTTVNDGPPSDYVEVSSPSPAKPWHIQTADSRWWSLWAPLGVHSAQLGCKGDGTTDDSAALQAWLDFAGAAKVAAILGSGVHIVPSATLNASSNTIIRGAGPSSELRRTGDNPVPVVEASSKSDVRIRDIKLSFAAGLASSSSVTISAGSKTWTVPAGVAGYAVGDYIMAVAQGDQRNIIIAQITAYSGTTMAATLTSSTGNGTYSSWFIGRHDGSNAAIRFINSTGCEARNVTVSGRFYVGIVSQNGDGDIIKENMVTGVINRGIYLYGASGTSRRCQVLDNRISGSSSTQYGISINGTTANAVLRARIAGNEVYATLFQGIGIGGGVSYITAAENIIDGVSDASGTGIVVEYGNSISPQRIKVVHNEVSGAAGTGIWIFDSYYCNADGNTVSGCGIGMVMSRVFATSCYYNSINDNTVHGCSSHGIQWTSNSSGTCGIGSCNGNKSVGNAGWGIIFDANTTTIAYTGNAASVNTTGQYSISGTGHVVGNV